VMSISAWLRAHSPELINSLEVGLAEAIRWKATSRNGGIQVSKS
jgi:hypothetical protein